MFSAAHLLLLQFNDDPVGTLQRLLFFTRYTLYLDILFFMEFD